MMTMQLSSHNNENRKSLRASSPLRDIEETRASGTRKETQEQGAEKESESSLARSLATRNGEVAQSKTFLGSHARSLLGEPVYFRNSEEKFQLLHFSNVHYGSKSSFSPISTIPLQLTTLRHDTKYPHVRVIQRRPSVCSDSVLLVLNFAGFYFRDSNSQIKRVLNFAI